MSATKAAEAAQVPSALLSQYVGTYDTEGDGTKHVIGVTLEDGTLWFDYDGKGKEPLVALSPARFSWSGTIVEFAAAGDGTMNMLIHYVEGDEGGPRRK